MFSKREKKNKFNGPRCRSRKLNVASFPVNQSYVIGYRNGYGEGIYIFPYIPLTTIPIMDAK